LTPPQAGNASTAISKTSATAHRNKI